MEAAKIDWKSIESKYVVDDVYENIDAPQWIDFLSPHLHSPDIHPDAWFCRPDCNHPKTAEDFLKSSPTSKLLRSVSVSKLIGLGDWTRRRETNLKRRGVGQCSTKDSNYNEDDENRNPNYHNYRSTLGSNKVAIITSKPDSKPECDAGMLLSSGYEDEDEAVKGKLIDPRSQSARDLFAGRDILGKITELCNELKKMATVNNRPKEKKEKEDVEQHPNSSPVYAKPPTRLKGRPILGQLDSDKERKPLLEVTKDTYQAIPHKCSPKHTPNRNLRTDEAENIPISLELKAISKHKEEEKLMPIWTNPPIPQGFSATRDPTKSTPSKGPKSRLMKRDVLQQMEQDSTLLEQGLEEKSEYIISGKQGRALDVLWFLKPCTF